MEKKTGEKGLMLGHFVLLLLECIVVLHGLQDDGQIGRASCRERGERTGGGGGGELRGEYDG